MPPAKNKIESSFIAVPYLIFQLQTIACQSEAFLSCRNISISLKANTSQNPRSSVVLTLAKECGVGTGVRLLTCLRRRLPTVVGGDA